MVMGDFTVETEVLIIGGGPGGCRAAIEAASLGLEVTMVDPHPGPGGANLFTSGSTVQSLIQATTLLRQLQHCSQWGFKYTDLSFNLKQFRAKAQEITRGFSKALERTFADLSIQFIKGRARFTSPHRVHLQDADIHSITFKNAVIATGARPIALPDLPFSKRIMDMAGALSLEDIPEKLLLLGESFVSLEIGTIYETLGSEVSLVTEEETLLQGIDQDLAEPVLKKLQKTFSHIYLSTAVEAVQEHLEGIDVKLAGRGGHNFSRVLVARGYSPNSLDLGLDTTSISLDFNNCVEVNDRLQTNEQHILAVGGVTDTSMPTCVAMAQGKVAAQILAGFPSAFDVRAIPNVLYTHPPLAWCGITENEAKAEYRPLTITQLPFEENSCSQILGEERGSIKILSEPEGGRLLGIGICGPGADELIAQGNLAIEMGALIEDLAQILHPHPSLSASIAQAASVAFLNWRKLQGNHTSQHPLP